MPFEKGRTGNPGGRPSQARAELADLLDTRYTKAKRVQTLDRLIALQKSDDERVALDAIKLLMAYTYGKPVERKEIGGMDGDALRIEVAYVDPAPPTSEPSHDPEPPGAV